MSIRTFHLVLVLLVSATILSGCTTPQRSIETGSLGDYSRLKPEPNYENTKVYLDPSFDKSAFKTGRVFVEPFEVWAEIAADSEIDHAQIYRLSTYFHERMREAIGKEFQLVDDAESATIVIRGVFSDVRVMAPGIGVADFIPIRVIINAGNSAYLTATNQKNVVSSVSLEAEFIDNRNKRRLFAMTATKELDVTVTQDPEGNVRAVKEVLDTWVRNFIANIK